MAPPLTERKAQMRILDRKATVVIWVVLIADVGALYVLIRALNRLLSHA